VERSGAALEWEQAASKGVCAAPEFGNAALERSNDAVEFAKKF